MKVHFTVLHAPTLPTMAQWGSKQTYKKGSVCIYIHTHPHAYAHIHTHIQICTAGCILHLVEQLRRFFMKFICVWFCDFRCFIGLNPSSGTKTTKALSQKSGKVQEKKRNCINLYSTGSGGEVGGEGDVNKWQKVTQMVPRNALQESVH